MNTKNRYENLIDLLDIKSSSDYSSTAKPQKVKFKSEKDRQLYFELNDLESNKLEHFPSEFNVIAAKNIVIDSENPLIIKDQQKPVALHFDTMTIMPGGQIKCSASALISVETLIKK